MKIETFAVCYNEERLLPYFLRHYLQYGSVTIFDNYSTDKSVEIAKAAGANVFQFNSDNKFREDLLLNIRNACWKESKADWVMVVDIDEFVYHRNFMWTLGRTEGTVVMPRMFEMHSAVLPTTSTQIYDEIRHGVEMRSKMCLFRPNEITEMDYDAGCHFAHPKGNYIVNVRTDIINMHFKYLSLPYLIEKYAQNKGRRSDEDKANNWNFHYEKTPDVLEKEFEDMKYSLIQVL